MTNREHTSKSTSAYRILVVDDDQKLQQLLKRYLTEQGFEVKVCRNIPEMEKLIVKDFFDLIVLDLMLPGESGLQACGRLRSAGNDTPILMLTAKGDETDRILGLEMGCDDYLSKPFNPRELVARINSILRRYYTPPVGSPEIEEGSYETKHFKLDYANRTITKGDIQTQLTTGQFALIKILTNNPGKSISRDELIGKIRKRHREVNERSIDIQMSRIRKIIEENPKKPKYIQTVWGYGYVFVPEGKEIDDIP